MVNGIDYTLRSNNLVDAVDYCFKIINVLNLEFSVECAHVWTFLHTFLYKFVAKNIKMYQVVSNLIEHINKS